MLNNHNNVLPNDVDIQQTENQVNTTSEENIMTSDKNERAYGWNKYSESKLVNLEKKILNIMKKAYTGWFVDVNYPPGVKSKIWTISMNTESKNIPLVLLHGFGAAVGFWCLNMDDLSENRPLYAIDILGFGRSSRPDFSSDPMKAEQELVESIEKWREKVALDKFILLGHSMGAYLATSYTINYPNRVQHLILADPWGFAERPPDFNPPFWLKTLAFFLYPLSYANPLATVRAAGPAGPWLIKKMRSDIASKYSAALGDPDVISDYIYQCNAQKPTGESAFHSMLKGFGWAKYPMLHRAHTIPNDISISVIHGSQSWMDRTIGRKLQELKPESKIDVEYIADAGHHIHADDPEAFNKIVCKICSRIDWKIPNQTPK